MLIQVIATGSSRWERFLRRWGLSFLIGEDILFDTFGDAGALLGNMRRLRVDTSKIRHVVLSHDHWDHTGGVWRLIRGRPDIKVYVCPGFSRQTKDRIVSSGACLVEVGPLTAIRRGVFSTGEMAGLFRGESIPEQALVIEYGRDLAVVSGCAHPGIVEMVDAVKDLFPERRVYSILGGLHLKDSSGEEIRRVVSVLRARGITRVAPTHCTGRMAIRALREEYGADFLGVKNGSVIEV